MSFDIEISIFRIVADCWASLSSKRSRSSLVTPSTMTATSGPKARLMSSNWILVSSTASWSRAAAMATSSIR